MSVPPRPVPASVNSWSPEFLDERYRAFQQDPESVEPELRSFFQGFELAQAGELKLSPGAGGAPPTEATPITASRPVASGPVRVSSGGYQPAGRTASLVPAVVDDLVDSYRDQGHLAARIDPFGRERERPESLSLAHHGLSEADLAQPVDGVRFGLRVE